MDLKSKMVSTIWGKIEIEGVGFTAGLFGIEQTNIKNAPRGSIISSSTSYKFGPVSITNKDGKMSLNTSASFRAGLGLIGIKLSGGFGIKEK